jgi:hypothetical protein
MCQDIVDRFGGTLQSLAQLKELADGDPDYELFVVRLKQLEILLRARAQMVMARSPQQRLEAQTGLDRARNALTDAM